jgi:hypothetical protein
MYEASQVCGQVWRIDINEKLLHEFQLYAKIYEISCLDHMTLFYS